MHVLEIKKGCKALVIIAHPDDETIWMGGTIMAHPEADWTILSLARSSDKDRAPKFRMVCRHYGAKALIADLEDDGRLGLAESVCACRKIIRKEIKAEKFDIIFTHGANGEYGHTKHKAAHRAVKSLFGENMLKAKQLIFFSYENTGKSKYSKLKPQKSSTVLIRLLGPQFLAKKNIMSSIYGFNPQGIDVGYCTNPEAFRIYKG